MIPRVTIDDIASDTRLSRKTVSLALRHDQSVAAATLRRVLDAAERLGYTRSRAETALLGVVVPYFNHPFYSE